MIPTLPDPTSWQDIERDEEKKEAFILAYKDTIEQLNLVEQYYEFKWDERAFGIDEHTWLRYVGAYRNLTWEPGAPEPITSPTVLVGKTKLSGTQVIDASHIINLIGSKTTSSNGKQMVDTETLRIIYQQIEELSNLGDHEQAQLLKQFVMEELEPGHISSDITFDEAFEIWKNDKKKQLIYEVSQEWGLDWTIFEKSVDAYSSTSPDDIPFFEDLIDSVDFESATKKQANHQLGHNLALTPYLTKVIPKIKSKYKS